MRKVIGIMMVVIALIVVANAAPAAACTGGGGGGTWWINHGNGVFWRLDHSVPLTDEISMRSCIIGTNNIPGVIEVKAVMLFKPETFEPFEQLQFDRNPVVARLIKEQAPVIGAGIDSIPDVTEWTGFHGFVDGAIPPGTEVDIAFEIIADPSLTAEELVNMYNQVGLVSMGGLTSDHEIDPDHFVIVRPMGHGIIEFGTQ